MSDSREDISRDPQSTRKMTPVEALRLLEDGNRRFRERHCAPRDLLREVEEHRAGQWPFAAVLGCMDSRVPAELIFDQGIGDVFNLRIAGNCVNDDILGCLEFACSVVGAKLVVVLGHTSCGAIMGACDGVELDHLNDVLARLQPAIEQTAEPRDPALRTSRNQEFVRGVAVRNVELTVEEIHERSPILAGLADRGAIAITGAMYDVGTGAVEFL